MEKKNSNFLMHKIPPSFLIEVRKRHINGNKKYISAIYRDLDVTLSSLTKLSSKLKDLGLIEQITQGRIKQIKLTKKGMKIADNLNNIDIILSDRH